MYMAIQDLKSPAETVEFRDALGNELKAGDRVVFATGARSSAANLSEGLIVKLYTIPGVRWEKGKRVPIENPKAKIRRVTVNGQNIDEYNASSNYWKKREYISIDKLSRRVAKLS